MKQIKFFVLSFLAFGLVNCSDDDKKTETKEIDVVGNWVGVKFLIEKPYDLNKDGVAGTDYKVELPCLIHDFEFKKDGTGLAKNNSWSADMDGKVSCVEYGEHSITWKLNEDKTKVLLTADDETIEVKIVNNTLEFHSASLLDSEIGIPGKIVYERK